MRLRSLVFLALLAAACGPSRPRDDGEDPEVDAGPVDSGPGPRDASTPDAGPVEVDAGEPDAGPVEVDAGEVDAGEVDAGEPIDDDGGWIGPTDDAGEPDASTPEPDAGPPPVDAGTPPVDAGTPIDAGDPDPVDAGGPDGGTVVGETCGTARLLALPQGVTRLTGESTELAKDDLSFLDNAGCVATGGPDRVYAVQVPAGQRLRATATPLDATFDVALNVIAGSTSRCASPVSTCAAPGRDVAFEGLAETVTYWNTSSSPVGLFLVVDSTAGIFGLGSAGGRYDLELELGVPPAGEVCELAPQVVFSGSSALLSGQTTNGYANDYGAGTGCTSTGGRDRAYAVSVPSQQRLVVTVTPAADFDPSIAIIEGDAAACGGASRTCVLGRDAAGAGLPERGVWANRGAARTFFVIVDSRGEAGGTYDLAFKLEALPTNDTCATALPLTLPATFTGDSGGAVADYREPSTVTCHGAAGVDVLYSVSVPPGKQLRASVRPATGETVFDPSIAIVAANACSTTAYACLTSNDDGNQGELNSVRWTNVSNAATTVYVVIDTVGSSGGSFVLEAQTADPPLGDSCATAPTLVPGTPVNASTVDASDDAGAGTGCVATGGPDLAYAVSIPAGKRLELTAIGVGEYRPSISLQIGNASICSGSGRACVMSSEVSFSSNTTTFAWTNETTNPVSGFVVVDSTDPTGGGFQLSAALATPSPGETCLLAERLQPGQTVTGTTVGYGNDFDGATGCRGTSGADRMYLVDVPPQKRLTATLVPSGAVDLSLQIVTGSCTTNRACLATSDATSTEVARWSNPGSTPVPVYVIVDGLAAGAYSLSTLVEDIPPPPPGDLCTAAVPLSLSATVTTVSSTLVSAGADFSPSSASCDRTPGPEVFYAVTIPYPGTLTATVTPLPLSSGGVWDPSIALVLGACPTNATACAAANDAGFGGQADSITYANGTGAPITGYLIVDCYLNDALKVGPFTLTATVTQ